MIDLDTIKESYVKKSEELCDININRAIHYLDGNSAFTWSARTADHSRVDYVFLNITGGTQFIETKTRRYGADNFNTCILEASKKDYLQWLTESTGAKVYYVAIIGDGRKTYWFEISRIPQDAWEYLPNWKCFNPINGKQTEPCYSIPWEYATKITDEGITFPKHNLPKIQATDIKNIEWFAVSGQRLRDLEFSKIKY